MAAKAPTGQKQTFANNNGPWGGFNTITYNTQAQSRKMLTPQDKAALPILTKKYNDPTSPENGMWQEQRLVRHVIQRCQLSDIERRVRIQRMEEIDTQLSGFVKLEKEDQKRDHDNKKGKAPKPIKHNLPLAYAQIDDCVTYCMSLFAPETNIFVATSTADKQSVAEALTKEIGKQGQTLQYYRNLCKFLLNAMKYNFGALLCNWEKCTGTTFTAKQNSQDPSASVGGQLTTTDGTVWEGNVLKSADMYNFLFDTAVHPCDLPLRGEYFAEVELVTPFTVKRKAEQKILFGINRFVNSPAPLANNTVGTTFYRSPPVLREFHESGGQPVNWRQVITAGGPAQQSQLGIELVWFTCWINPQEFDLAPRDRLECWRLCIANGQYLAAAVDLEITHGQLPVACGAPLEDDLNNQQRTYAEMLLPLQHFASFLLNTHVDATRKAIYGITVYDKAAFPGLDLSTDDLIGARLPMKSTAQGQTIDQIFRHFVDAPETDQNVEMIAKIVDLMQKILPTNMANQVADLERATEYQAAAVVQASSRRNLKIARLLNDQAISMIKFQMMYNIYQNIPVIQYNAPDGTPQQITPKDILDAAIEFDIGTGLKGLDRLMQVSIFKDLMAYLFQVKGMDQQVDLLGLLSYVTQIAGFETDLSRFRIAQPAQAVAAAANAENGQAGQNGQPSKPAQQSQQPQPGGAPASQPAPANSQAAA